MNIFSRHCPFSDGASPSESLLSNLLLKIHTDIGKLLFFSHKVDDGKHASKLSHSK